MYCGHFSNCTPSQLYMVYLHKHSSPCGVLDHWPIVYSLLSMGGQWVVHLLEVFKSVAWSFFIRLFFNGAKISLERERTKLHSRQNGKKARGKLLVIKMGKIKSKDMCYNLTSYSFGHPSNNLQKSRLRKRRGKKPTPSLPKVCQMLSCFLWPFVIGKKIKGDESQKRANWISVGIFVHCFEYKQTHIIVSTKVKFKYEYWTIALPNSILECPRQTQQR